MTRNADEPVTVDARGMRCPWPVLRAARAMRERDHVILIADDPVALRDVPEMAQMRGWQCSVEQGEVNTQFFLTKTTSPSGH